MTTLGQALVQAVSTFATQQPTHVNVQQNLQTNFNAITNDNSSNSNSQQNLQILNTPSSSPQLIGDSALHRQLAPRRLTHWNRAPALGNNNQQPPSSTQSQDLPNAEGQVEKKHRHEKRTREGEPNNQLALPAPGNGRGINAVRGDNQQQQQPSSSSSSSS